MHLPSMKPSHASSSSSPKKSLLSSAVATVVNHQQISALFPLHQLMQHNYIIKTCMTTYTYLTTVVQNKRSAISTFETIVSVVTTESISNYPDMLADIKPTKVRIGTLVDSKHLQNPIPLKTTTNFIQTATFPPSPTSKMSLNNYLPIKPLTMALLYQYLVKSLIHILISFSDKIHGSKNNKTFSSHKHLCERFCQNRQENRQC